MTFQIPFLYVNLLALCAFVLMFFIFLAAKKTPEMQAFLALMFTCVLWTAGSIFMRLQLWPSMHFWYYVSLLAIFSMEAVFYVFLTVFSRQKGKLLALVFCAATVALYPGTLSGYYLPPPEPVLQPDGSMVYVYHADYLPMVLPCLLFVAIIIASTLLLMKMKREQGAHSSGVWLLFWGGLIILAGNLMQIFIPGNTFPFDTLSGVFFAALVMLALYRRRMFRMTLVASRGLLMVIVASVCAVLGAFFVDPAYRFFTESVGLDFQLAMTAVSVLLAIMMSLSYAMVRRMIDALFIREQQQNRLVKSFSDEVTQSLSTGDIMAKLAAVIDRELPVAQIYVCLAEEEGFVSRYSSNPLVPTSFTIDRESPKVRYLQEQEPYLIMREYYASVHAISDWAEEKELFQRLQIDCIAALRDGQNVVGLVMLAAKDHRRPFHAAETSFLQTVCSIASIAVKNAGLYEKMFREARIDALTGAYNYRYFVERLEEEYHACRSSCLTLMYIDVDDFKLYNQLYGVKAGDAALRSICEAINMVAMGENGTVFRTSGKVFALLLPHQDANRASTLAKEIRRRIGEINDKSGRVNQKQLSVSVGICSAPYAASSARELMDNADLATYNAKRGGKDQTAIFRGAQDLKPVHLAERTDAIVGRIERGNAEYRSMLSMISALTAAIDAKDHYTYDHSQNVARYAANLAVAAGLNEDQVRTIYAGGLLHDIGKISIPENILNKSGRLTDEEYAIMKGHVNNSIEMIRHLPEMDYLIPAALGHHERWDGRGYPRGLAGEEIPVSARCLAIADVFDAMTTDRPYRKGLSIDYAVQELEKGAGTQFDPKLAMIFAQLIRDREIPLSAQLEARTLIQPASLQVREDPHRDEAKELRPVSVQDDEVKAATSAPQKLPESLAETVKESGKPVQSQPPVMEQPAAQETPELPAVLQTAPPSAAVPEEVPAPVTEPVQEEPDQVEAEEEIFVELQPQSPGPPPGDQDPLPEQIYLWDSEPEAMVQQASESAPAVSSKIETVIAPPIIKASAPEQNPRAHAQQMLQSASLQQIQEILRTLQVLQAQDPSRTIQTGNSSITENHC